MNLQHSTTTTASSFKKFFITLSVPEAKLLILFFFYWTAIILVTHAISFVIRKSDSALEKVEDFVICSVGGYRPECIPLRENLVDGNTIIGLVLVILMNTLLAFASWANLFFVIQSAELKALFKGLFDRCISVLK